MIKNKTSGARMVNGYLLTLRVGPAIDRLLKTREE